MAAVINGTQGNAERLAERLQLMHQIQWMQTSGRLWRPSQVVVAVYADALDETWWRLARRSDRAKLDEMALLDWVNGQLQQQYAVLMEEDQHDA